MGEVEAPYYGKEGLGWLRKKGFSWNFSLEILSPLIGAALKQCSVAKQLVIVIVNVIVNVKQSSRPSDGSSLH